MRSSLDLFGNLLRDTDPAVRAILMYFMLTKVAVRRAP